MNVQPLVRHTDSLEEERLRKSPSDHIYGRSATASFIGESVFMHLVCINSRLLNINQFVQAEMTGRFWDSGRSSLLFMRQVERIFKSTVPLRALVTSQSMNILRSRGVPQRLDLVSFLGVVPEL